MICIAFLNEFCSIEISKPSRCFQVCDQFYKVKKLKFSDTDEINIQYYLKQRCDEMFKFDLQMGIKEKTANRRYPTNKKTDEIHLYQDILTLNGYKFVIQPTSGNNNTYKLCKIVNATKNGGKILKEHELSLISNKIKEMLSRRLLEQNGNIFIQQHDEEIKKILIDY